ncbi:MAG: hypothetical protein U0W40_18390 [Acidimicrobiia bacterium]
MKRAGVWTIVGLVALLLLRVAVVGIALDSRATSPGRHVHRHGARDHATVLPGDVRRYHRIATRKGVPYRDFEVEYPPLTLAAIDALNGHNVRESTVNLMWSQLGLDVAIAAVVAWAWGRRAMFAYLVLGLAFLWYPFLYLRLDLLSVLLAVLALALVKKRHTIAGGAGLAVACFAKLWPVVLVPRMLTKGKRAGVAAFGVVGAIGVGLWVGLTGTGGPEQVLTFRGADGWQIESTIGSMVHTFGSAPARMEEGAMRAGIVPDVARLGLPVLGIALVALVWWLAARARSTDATLLDGLAPLGAITALLVTATILSPQYVSWLLPFAAIAWAGGEKAVAGLTATAAFLSTLGLNLVKELNAGQSFPAAVVLGRNVALLALLVVVIARIVEIGRRERRASAAVPPSEVVQREVVGVRRPEPVPATITARSLGPNGGLLAARRDRRS